MADEQGERPIPTRRLELVVVTSEFVEAVVAGDGPRAGAAIRATVGQWLTADPSHLVQLNLARQSAEARGLPGLGRAILRGGPRQPRSVIGTIGFHGPPDERGRLEASCRIQPAQQGRAFAAEALGALLDWATVRYGVTRFLVALPARQANLQPFAVEIAVGPDRPTEPTVGQIARLLEREGRAG